MRRGFPLLTELLLPRACVLCGLPLLLSLGMRRGAAEGAPLPGPATGLADAPLCEACRMELLPAPEPRCERCGRPLISESRFCLRCRGVSWAFDSAWPLWRFAGQAAALIAAYKFGGRSSLAPFFAKLLAARATDYPGAVLVSAPCSPASLRKRGWDQSGLLVREIARRGFPRARLLSRAPGKAQKTLDYEGRRMNLKGAISLRAYRAPERVLLVDDVLTTGATLSACAAILKEAGASRVDALVLAAD